MTYQTGSRILTAVRRETTMGTLATATSTAYVLRVVGGDGLRLDRAQIRSAEKLASGLQSQGRLGGKSVTGGYDCELRAGGANDIFTEALQRNAWSTNVTVGFATLTTVSVGTNTLTATGGSWITEGIRVGDVFKLTGTSDATNHKNVRVLSVSTSIITVATGTFATVSASASGTVTRLKKVVNGSTAPTRFSHSIEQLDQDITQSERFVGNRLVGIRYSFRPGAMARVTYTFEGLDRTTAAAAYFSNTVEPTTLALVADDSFIRFNGTTVAYFTGFDLDFAITNNRETVIGSLVSPDIFDNDLGVTGTVTALRSDFAALTLFDAETEFEMSILLQEPVATAGTPPPCFGIYLPRVKIAAVSGSPAGGGDGAKTETRTLMFGPKVADTDEDYGVAIFHSSEAAT